MMPGEFQLFLDNCQRQGELLSWNVETNGQQTKMLTEKKIKFNDQIPNVRIFFSQRLMDPPQSRRVGFHSPSAERIERREKLGTRN